MENKTSKYFKYAIGEIILVVIGILIALQINTWNKQQEEHQLELKIIEEIRSNLNHDLDEIQEDIAIMADINSACDALKTYINTQEIPSEELFITAGLLRVTPHFDPNTSGYGLLVSKGIGVISSDSLRNDISLHYERLYNYYKRYEEERIQFHALHSEPKLIEHFSPSYDANQTYYVMHEISQEDFSILKKDKAFIKVVSAIAFENSSVKNRAERVESSILSLITALDKEIKVLKE
ncbi:DUF6090 family protein [Psychroserpens ponticola]|uniref:DUF6090 family protein n=1 Tax=Psychroserpens ponticola TaxID=2932268 RepID=A0ABY7S1C3_9FLAO|nr:DUF6090 family protein [Psychroserpens ponticola]WCO02721.1 DUF6090 family protein [Psychroserpens ponticola]